MVAGCKTGSLLLFVALISPLAASAMSLSDLDDIWDQKERASWQEMKVCIPSESNNLQALPTYPNRKKLAKLLTDTLADLPSGLIDVILDYVEGYQELQQLTGKNAVIALLAVGGGKLAVCTADSIQIVDAQQKVVHDCTCKGVVTCIALLDNDTLIVGTTDDGLSAFSITSGKCVATYQEPYDVSCDIPHSYTGISSIVPLGNKRFAAGYNFGPIRVWSLTKDTFECERTLCKNLVGGVVITCSDYNTKKLSTYYPTKPFLFTTSYDELVSVTAGGHINIWDLQCNEAMCCKKLNDDGKNTLVLPSQTTDSDYKKSQLCPVDSAAMVGKGLLALGLDGGVLLCDYEKGTCPCSLIDKKIQVLCLALLPNGLLVVGGSDDDGKGIIKFWDVKTGECVQQIDTKSPVRCLCQLPDGKVAFGFADGSIMIYG